MPSPATLHGRDLTRQRPWAMPAGLLAVAAVCFAAGAMSLAEHLRDPRPLPYRAPASLVQLALAVVQMRIAWSVYRRSRSIATTPLFRKPSFWRWLLVGMVASYVLGLALGESAGAAYFFRAALVFWYTVMLVPLVAHPRLVKLAKAVSRRSAVRALGEVLSAAALVFVAVEISLRVYARVASDPLPATYVVQRLMLPPGSWFRGRAVNGLGYWDDEFVAERRPHVSRVAVVGDRVLLSGTSRTNFLVQLERRLSGIEVYNFGIPRAGPREYVAQFTYHVARFEPDVVVAFLSVDDDIADELPLPGTFDWRGLRMYQLGERWLGGSVPSVAQPTTARQHAEPSARADREAYLEAAAARLGVCRTPIDDAMRARWNVTLGHLDDLVARCRSRRIEPAIVLVPAVFQVNRSLLATLCRRRGYQLGEVDVELPQRRMKAYAHQRGIPVLDLLSHLRASSDPLYCRNDFDFNDRGNEIVAATVSSWLAAQFGTLPPIASR